MEKNCVYWQYLYLWRIVIFLFGRFWSFPISFEHHFQSYYFQFPFHIFFLSIHERICFVFYALTERHSFIQTSYMLCIIYGYHNTPLKILKCTHIKQWNTSQTKCSSNSRTYLRQCIIMVLRGIYKFPSCSMPHIELYAKQATTNDEVEKVKKSP